MSYNKNVVMHMMCHFLFQIQYLSKEKRSKKVGLHTLMLAPLSVSF